MNTSIAAASPEERARNADAVRSFFDPSRRADRPGLFAEDMRMFLPFAGRVLPRILWDGLDELEEMEAMVQTMFTGLRHYDVDIYECVDGRQFFVRSRYGENDTLLYGRPYPQRFIHHFTVVDGKIRRWDEYFDSALLADVLDSQTPLPFPDTVDLRAGTVSDPADRDRVRAENEKVIRQFLTVDPYDPDARRSLWAPNAVKELAWIPSGFPVWRWSGPDELAEETSEGRTLFDSCWHADLKIFPTTDPEIFWATSRMDPRCRQAGRRYPQLFVLGFRVENGKVAVFQEYFDTALLAAVHRPEVNHVNPGNHAALDLAAAR